MSARPKIETIRLHNGEWAWWCSTCDTEGIASYRHRLEARTRGRRTHPRCIMVPITHTTDDGTAIYDHAGNPVDAHHIPAEVR